MGTEAFWSLHQCKSVIDDAPLVLARKCRLMMRHDILFK